MAEPQQFPPAGWMHQNNRFGFESRNFQEDIHMLILSSLDAGIAHLKQEAEKEDAALMQKFQGASEDDRDRYLGDLRSDIFGYIDGQERFLRNIGLVALLSRLTHALNTMARSGERISPRDPKGYAGDDELKQLCNEYRTRFGIVFGPKQFQFLEPLRKARNRIVHHGGEANPRKPFSEIGPNPGPNDYLDYSFSKKYKRFVKGEGSTAEINITAEQLDAAIESSMALVRYAADQLRAKELEMAEKEKAVGLWKEPLFGKGSA